MPGKVKVRIVAGRNLPVMDRASDTCDAFVEIKLSNTTYKTEVFRHSLNPEWNSEWFRFEVDDEELQDEPLQIRVMDYDTYSANDAIGKVYIDLNPLLCKESGSLLSGWFPIYDTMHGIRGEINVMVRVHLFSDSNKYRESSCGVQFFYSSSIPWGFKAKAILGFVEELVVNDDPEYQWIDKIRTPRASNEARQTLFSKLSGEVQRKIGLKALELGGNAVIGYHQCFDLEGESGIVVRGIGTAVILTENMSSSQTDALREVALRRVSSSTSVASVQGCDPRSSRLFPLLGSAQGRSRSPSPIKIGLSPGPFKIVRSNSSVSPKKMAKARSELFSPVYESECAICKDTSQPKEKAHQSLRCSIPAQLKRFASFKSSHISMSQLKRICSDPLYPRSPVLEEQIITSAPGPSSPTEKICHSPAKGAISAVHRRSSDSDLSTTPKEVVNFAMQVHLEVDSSDFSELLYSPSNELIVGKQITTMEVYTSDPDLSRKRMAIACLTDDLGSVAKRLQIFETIDSNEKHILATSQGGLPFLEYELHRQLLNKLKVKCMNAIFGLKVQVSVGDKLIIGIATGTGAYLSALPPPSIPKLACGKVADDKKMAEVQKQIQGEMARNKEYFGIKLPSVDNPSESSMSGKNEDGNSSGEEDLPDLDLSAGNKDACILEVDDADDVDIIAQLIDPKVPPGFDLCNTETLPGLDNFVCNLQMFTRIYRKKFSSPPNGTQVSKTFEAVIKSLFVKLRRLVPCCLTNLSFQVDLVEQDELQVTVLGIAVGLGESNLPSSTNISGCKQKKNSADSELMFHMDDDKNSELSSSSGRTRRVSLQSNDRSYCYHLSLGEHNGVDITPLSYIPGKKIEQYLGDLDFFFIRESSSIRESGGLNGFIQSFVAETLAIVRAHVSALGGNAMVGFHMTQCILLHNPHKNQGQCLVNVAGDAVFVHVPPALQPVDTEEGKVAHFEVQDSYGP
ncbi:C2 domain-containing protein 5 [Araneus ventricosus]|uniref:C2 domain-containing protein 5 n=1 Tax=Araneus ventricosus TaxID=182803 RepID=A0A4Y2K0J5_ARAVE|nr:C2 domain-containing protein 5 [Araneus ventricosus]